MEAASLLCRIQLVLVGDFRLLLSNLCVRNGESRPKSKVSAVPVSG